MALSLFTFLCNYHLCLVPKCCHHPLKTFKEGSHVGFWTHKNEPVTTVLPFQGSVKFSFSHSVVSDSLWPHGLQHARPPCLSPTPGIYSNSCPTSRWCHPTISSSVIPFSLLQSYPVSRFFQLFTSGGQSIGVLASASVLPMNIQDWFPGVTSMQ